VGNSIKPSTPPPKPNTPAKPIVKPITPTSGAAKPTPGGKTPALTVASTSSKKEEIGVQTLVGDYTEAGSNHGRKYYQKVQEIPGHKDVKVFLYYWDMRDGNDFAGWWFGDELGGSQVWARCSSHGNVPPPAGWKIPWDAPKAEPGLLTVNPYKGKAGVPAATSLAKPVQPVAATGQTAAPSVASVVARVKKATAQVETLEKTSKEVVTKAKAMTATSPEAAMKQLQGTLTAEQNKLTEAQKSLTQDINEARKAGPLLSHPLQICPSFRQGCEQLRPALPLSSTRSRALLIRLLPKLKTPPTRRRRRNRRRRTKLSLTRRSLRWKRPWVPQRMLWRPCRSWLLPSSTILLRMQVHP
jgi:hypothetical protein